MRCLERLEVRLTGRRWRLVSSQRGCTRSWWLDRLEERLAERLLRLVSSRRDFERLRSALRGGERVRPRPRSFARWLRVVLL